MTFHSLHGSKVAPSFFKRVAKPYLSFFSGLLDVELENHLEALFYSDSASSLSHLPDLTGMKGGDHEFMSSSCLLFEIRSGGKSPRGIRIGV